MRLLWLMTVQRIHRGEMKDRGCSKNVKHKLPKFYSCCHFAVKRMYRDCATIGGRPSGPMKSSLICAKAGLGTVVLGSTDGRKFFSEDVCKFILLAGPETGNLLYAKRWF